MNRDEGPLCHLTSPKTLAKSIKMNQMFRQHYACPRQGLMAFTNGAYKLRRCIIIECIYGSSRIHPTCKCQSLMEAAVVFFD